MSSSKRKKKHEECYEHEGDSHHNSGEIQSNPDEQLQYVFLFSTILTYLW